MKDKLDVFLLAERITDDEYKELMQMMLMQIAELKAGIESE